MSRCGASCALAVVCLLLAGMVCLAGPHGDGDAAPPPAPVPPAGPFTLDRRAPRQAAGTARMSRMLLDIARRSNAARNPFMSAERAELLRREVAVTKEPQGRAAFTFQLATELLFSGRPEAAIATVRELMRPDSELRPFAPPDRVLREFLVVCHLRVGEQENCIEHHGVESCLLPIRGSGVHTQQRGSRAAIGELLSLLEGDPEDLSLRWLLNLAAMTVGDYPDKVPSRLLMPPGLFASEHDIGRFHDVAGRAGLGVRGRSGGSVMEDLDGDGLLDVMVSSSGMRDQLRFFRNAGNGTFSERTEAAGLIGELGGLNLASADYDNDGDVDVLVLRGAWLGAEGRIPNSLLRNNGDGTFEDVTEAAGLLSFRPTQVAAWGDYDNDGSLDLFIGNESAPDDRHPSELYHNNADGTFTLASASLGNPDLGFVKGAAWGDIDNDGRPDLYVSVGRGDNLLFHNGGPRAPAAPDGREWLFREVARQAGVTEPRFSFATWFWDYDNDGWEDLYVSPYAMELVGDAAAMYMGRPAAAEVPRLYRNNRDGTFTDVAKSTGLDRVALVMGANFGDLDNDGWLDCYLGTGNPQLEMLIPNRMFRNAGGGRFQDVTTSGGFGHLQKGHGVSFGDIDNDGDQDVFQEMGGAYTGDVAHSVLYENPGHGNRWVTLRLEGRRSNRTGVGARVTLRAATPSGERDIRVTAGTGGSFGVSSIQQEIGLGAATALQSIEVRWPATGIVQVFRDVPMDRAYRVTEGVKELVPLTLKRIDLSPE